MLAARAGGLACTLWEPQRRSRRFKESPASSRTRSCQLPKNCCGDMSLRQKICADKTSATTDGARSRSVPATQPNPDPMKQQTIPESHANLSPELIEPEMARSAQPNADGEQWWPETPLSITAPGNSGFAGYPHWG